MHADLVLKHGRICTVDAARPWAEGAAVVGERIVAVGAGRDLEAWTGPGTRVIDLQGRLVLPGFIDSHVHFIQGGMSLLSVQLRDADGREALAARLAGAARQLPAGEWIVEGNWDHQRFPGAELPRRDWIDAATPEHPVCVSRLDGHMVLCNSLALRLAGVDRNTPTPDGGEIVRDPLTGEPTGILKDAASRLVYRIIPPPAPAQLRRIAQAALAEAAGKGVTTVHDVSGEEGFGIYQDLLGEGGLTSRISFFLPVASVQEVLKLRLQSGFGSTRLRFAGLKGFTDGSLGSGTACFFEPYSDEPGNAGLFHDQMFPEGIMGERLCAADSHGLRLAVHAIGDRAVASLIDLFQQAAQANPAWDRRFRMEHAQHVRPQDLARMAGLGVIASVQPYHAIDDGRWAGRRIGPERARMAFPYRAFLDAGIPMAFGSDWPVAPMDPILGIHAAVTRRTLDGRHPDGWIPEQRVPLAAAIAASTLGGAFAEGAEREKGSIAPGKLADFAVLDRDLFGLAPERIAEAQVAMTICGGTVIFER